MEIFKKISSLKILYIAAFSFVFIASFALSTWQILKKDETLVVAKKKIPSLQTFTPIPILVGTEPAPVLDAKAILAKDVESGVTLFSYNPDERLFPASTTKMLTAMTALDYYDLNQIITVHNINVEGQKMRLIEGEEMSVRDLIKGLLIYSANDAAEVLASNYCTSDFVDIDVNLDDPAKQCGREYFIEAMNSKAKFLKLHNSNFKNPTGLDMEGHLTTANDLAIIASEAMKNPIIREIVGTKNATVESIDGKNKHKLVNLNELVGKVEGVLGVKTGWTENAGENLATFIERGDKKVVIVILGSTDRFGETTSLIDWVFNNYEWREVSLIN